MYTSRVFICVLLSLVLGSGCSRFQNKEHEMVSIQLLDRKGFQETITSKERLKGYKEVDFSSPQPYRKVMRTYRAPSKSPRSLITSYHENGELYQSLEVENGRAHGIYKEFHPNGHLALETKIVEGAADLTDEAKRSWVFDGKSSVWDPNGILLAQFSYERGSLEGEGLYYHPNGLVKRIVPYLGNQPHGREEVYDEKGTLLSTIEYKEGVLDGASHFHGNEASPPFHETFSKGLLLEGTYKDFSSHITHQIIKGKGKKSLYEKGELIKEITFHGGIPEGEVCEYNKGHLSSKYTLLNGEKEGEEWVYTPDGASKVYLEWKDGEIHGRVKTWYPSGVQESEREMSRNIKHGSHLGWYLDGSLMFFEEYEEGVLIKGRYMKKGGLKPISSVSRGNGVATLFDGEGRFLRTVSYEKGVPITP